MARARIVSPSERLTHMLTSCAWLADQVAAAQREEARARAAMRSLTEKAEAYAKEHGLEWVWEA